MAEGEQFSRKGNGAFLKGFAEITWNAGSDAMGRVIDVGKENERRAISEAEEALHSGDAERAVEVLVGLELSSGTYARSLAIEAANKLEDWQLLIRIIAKPQSVEEAVLLVSALIRTGALERAIGILTGYPDIDPATRRELEGQMETRRVMRDQ